MLAEDVGVGRGHGGTRTTGVKVNNNLPFVPVGYFLQRTAGEAFPSGFPGCALKKVLQHSPRNGEHVFRLRLARLTYVSVAFALLAIGRSGSENPGQQLRFAVLGQNAAAVGGGWSCQNIVNHAT